MAWEVDIRVTLVEKCRNTTNISTQGQWSIDSRLVGTHTSTVLMYPVLAAGENRQDSALAAIPPIGEVLETAQSGKNGPQQTCLDTLPKASYELRVLRTPDHLLG